MVSRAAEGRSVVPHHFSMTLFSVPIIFKRELTEHATQAILGLASLLHQILLANPFHAVRLANECSNLCSACSILRLTRSWASLVSFPDILFDIVDGSVQHDLLLRALRGPLGRLFLLFADPSLEIFDLRKQRIDDFLILLHTSLRLLLSFAHPSDAVAGVLGIVVGFVQES